MFYLLLSIIIAIIAIRIIWVQGIHCYNEKLKSDYMYIFNDNTMRRRTKRSRFMDYFKIWLWVNVDFLKQEYKEKLKDMRL